MKMLIVLTSHAQLGATGKQTGFYLSELTHALDVFARAGIDADFVSPRGGRPPIDGLNLNDPLNKAFMEDRRWMQRLENTLRPGDVRVEDYDALYVPGGHGTMFDLPQDVAIADLIARIYARGAVVSAVCHGPAALVNVKLPDGTYLVGGKEVSAFTNDEEAAVELTRVMPFLLESKLVERGAQFRKAPNFQKFVVVSERLVTGQNPASAPAVADAVVKLLDAKRAQIASA